MISSIFLVIALQQQTLHPSVQSVTSSSAAPPARQLTHHVTAGDTLSTIAPAMGESWQQLYVNNRSVIGANPNLIYVGEVLHAGPAVTGRAVEQATALAAPAQTSPAPEPRQAPAPQPQAQAATYRSSGIYSYAELERLWESAGGPSWAAAHAASIAECESGGNPDAYNPSGATGIWQILGAVVGGNLRDPYVNALNAVSKFDASGQTFAQWVCQ